MMMTRERGACKRSAGRRGTELGGVGVGNAGHEDCWARKRWSGKEAPRKVQTFVHEQVLEYDRKP
jgi:hypothetical protein